MARIDKVSWKNLHHVHAWIEQAAPGDVAVYADQVMHLGTETPHSVRRAIQAAAEDMLILPTQKPYKARQGNHCRRWKYMVTRLSKQAGRRIAFIGEKAYGGRS